MPLKRHRDSGGFGVNVARIAGGTALGQGIVLLSMPLVSRLYTPVDFGLQAVYISLLSTLTVMACLRFDLAVPLPREEEDAANILGASLLSVGGVALVALALCLTVARRLLGWIHAGGLTPYLVWVLPIGVFGAGMYQAMSAWAMRQRDYPLLAKTRIHQGSAQVVTQLGLGLLPFGPLGLLIGADIGRVNGAGTLLRAAWRGQGASLRKISWQGIQKMVVRYRDFPLISAGSAVVNALGLYIPVVLFTAEFGPAWSGQFSLAQRVIGLPVILVGQAVAQVYLSEGAALLRENPGGLHALAKRTMTKLLGLAVIPVTVLVIGAPWLFRWIFGAQWAEAGQLARLLSPLFLLQFATFPISQTLIILEKQRLQLAWDFTRLAAVLAAVLVPTRLGIGPTGTLVSFALALGVLYFAMLVLIMRETRPERLGAHG